MVKLGWIRSLFTKSKVAPPLSGPVDFRTGNAYDYRQQFWGHALDGNFIFGPYNFKRGDVIICKSGRYVLTSVEHVHADMYAVTTLNELRFTQPELFTGRI